MPGQTRTSRKSSPATTLFTVGYEGRTPHSLVDVLVENKVALLVDVRERAQSRKRGFSKSALRSALESEGVGYAHIRALGSPSEIRNQAREDGDMPKFFRLFRRHLLRQATALGELASLARKSRVAVLCFERDAACCHRSEIAAHMRDEERFAVVHL